MISCSEGKVCERKTALCFFPTPCLIVLGFKEKKEERTRGLNRGEKDKEKRRKMRKKTKD